MERGGLERLDLDQPGLERRGLDRGGVERRRLGQPGLERRRLGRIGLERRGLGARLGQLSMEVTSPAASRVSGIPAATWIVVAGSIAGGVATLGLAGWQQPGWAQVSGSQWIIAAAMGVLVLGSWIWPVVVYREGESEAFNMDEAFFVILALLVPPLVTLGTLALATVTAQAVSRRPLVKSAFNAGQVVIAAGLGISAEPWHRRSDCVPDPGTDHRRDARRSCVLRRQHPAGGRRAGLDGHVLARAHR